MSDAANGPYPHVGKADLPEIERRILEYWAAEHTFEASVEQRPVDAEYVFYDGPPFANGLPHHGHLLTGYVKDVVPRYFTMKGRRVERRFGWDCHGLPAEMEAEKELPVAGRASIIEYGIERFNEYCRTSVLKYTEEWRKTVTRQARWVDFDNDYKTMDRDYMESVMWAFKQLWDKGLIYQSNRVLPYSWGAETPLSNHEIRLDDATRPRQDPAITVAFELDDPAGLPGSAEAGGTVSILAWTTTPWTLPSNLALSVGPELQYAVMRDADGSRYVLSEDAVESYERQLREAVHIGTISGSELVGRTYVPLFDFFADMAEVDPKYPIMGRTGPSWCLPATSSTPPKAPGSCTWRPASARTTSGWRPRRVSAPWCRSTIRGASPRRSPTGRASTCSKPTPGSSRRCATRAGSCATTATPTTTRTAGAPTHRSSTKPCPAGM